MRIYHPDIENTKGWFEGPWNTDLAISIGYAHQGIQESHLHKTTTEIYLVASGSSIIIVEDQKIRLGQGDMIIIEPGERHTFHSSSDGYFHFVIHVPGLAGENALSDKVVLPT
jgi:mannose-6-phosphate isomerase-like protein (cupin superfamily)